MTRTRRSPRFPRGTSGTPRPRIRNSLPELPAAKRARFETQYGLPHYDASVLTGERALAEVRHRVAMSGSRSKTDKRPVVATVAKRHRDVGVDEVFAALMRKIDGVTA